jgi:nucleotide-binding universal stress UspA family protein
MACLPVHTPVAALPKIQSILFATDFSSASERALKYALAIAAPEKPKLFVVHALPSGAPQSFSDMGGRDIDPTRKQAEGHLRVLENSGVLDGIEHWAVMEEGNVWDVLLKVIKNKNIDLIVLGTHGRGGIKKLVMGSVAEQVLRLATCPVLTIGSYVPEPTSMFAFRRILLATDFSSGSLHGPYATALAKRIDAKVILLHVLDPTKVGWSGQIDSMRAQAEKRLRQLIPENNTAQIEPRIQFGSPGYVIVATAEKELADLIVMGAHPTRAVGTSTHLPWTVAHHVVCHAPCPVLTVLGQIGGKG